MNKKRIIDFFDSLAQSWDENTIRNDIVINTILDNASVNSSCTVLDVACGTGVLIPDYLSRKAAHITAVDFSPEMIRIAREKFRCENLDIICGDIEEISLERKYDCIVIYNALPHFPDPENLIRVLTHYLKPGATLTIAHGMSREQIDKCHHGRAQMVSLGLMHEDELAVLMGKYLKVTVKISNDQMYQLIGIKSE